MERRAPTLVRCTHPLARLLQTSDVRIVMQARTDQCLDVREGRGGWDGRLQLWECGSSNPNQQFRWDGAPHWRHWCVGTVWDGALVAATVGCADPSARLEAGWMWGTGAELAYALSVQALHPTPRGC